MESFQSKHFFKSILLALTLCFTLTSTDQSRITHLTSVDLKGSLFTVLDQYLVRLLELYKAKSRIVGLTRLTGCHDDDVSVVSLVILL